MKYALRFTSLLLATGLTLVSCKQQPTESNWAQPFTTGAASSGANPALTYHGSKTVGGTSYSTVAVMDTDGSHQTNIYTASSSSSTALSAGGRVPTWSPDGSKIAFIERSVNGLTESLKRIDVTVVNGVPQGSNTTTLYTTGTTDSTVMYSQAYSSLSTTNKIAFEVNRWGTASSHWSKLYVISASGGTPTLLYSGPTGSTPSGGFREFHDITWSPDDSKIAFIDYAGGYHGYIIRIIDASTGVQTDSIVPNYHMVKGLEWSRSGQNLLAFGTYDSTGTTYSILRYVAPTTGSTPTSNGVLGAKPTWAPDNSSLLVRGPDNTYLKKVVAQSSSTTNLTNAPNAWVKWKR